MTSEDWVIYAKHLLERGAYITKREAEEWRRRAALSNDPTINSVLKKADYYEKLAGQMEELLTKRVEP